MPIRGSPNGANHLRPQAGRDRLEQVVAINRNAWSHQSEQLVAIIRCAQPAGEQGLGWLRRRAQQQDTGDPAPRLRPAQRGLSAAQDPHLHAAGPVAVAGSTPAFAVGPGAGQGLSPMHGSSLRHRQPRCGHDGQRKRVAHMPTAATTEDSRSKLAQNHPHDFSMKADVGTPVSCLGHEPRGRVFAGSVTVLVIRGLVRSVLDGETVGIENGSYSNSPHPG
jgi:hypothetical protein